MDYYSDDDDELQGTHCLGDEPVPFDDEESTPSYFDYGDAPMSPPFDMESTVMEAVYRENQLKERLPSAKNWIPENIMLTTQENAPIIYINSTQERPEIYPIKLATITLNAELPVYFNLKVISLYLPLDDYIVGIKCEQIAQRGEVKQKNVKKKKPKTKGRKDRADFYNQCTINVRPYGPDSDEKINMKFFPNGKIGFTGVKKIKDAEVALEYVLTQIDKLSGPVLYKVNTVERGNAKNFRKKLKQKLDWLNKITENSPDYHVDWDEFINSIDTRGPNPYPNGITLRSEVAYSLTFLEILQDHYAPEADIENESFQDLIDLVKNSYKIVETDYRHDETRILCSYYAATKPNLADFAANCSIEDIALLFYFYAERNINMDMNKTMSQILSVLGMDDSKMVKDQLTELIERRQTKGGVLTDEECDQICQVYHQVFSAEKSKRVYTLEDLKVGDEDDEEEEDEDDETEKPARFTLNLNAWSHPTGDLGESILDYYTPDCINISNINTTFNTNFVLSREKLHKILINKYNQTDCSFEPNYGGINLKYTSVVDCPKHDDPNDPDIYPECEGCKCKYVSILIFSNITLITGGRSFRQIQDAYEFIREVLLREFVKIIKINKDVPDPIDKYPNVVATNTHKYLKKKYILENPKNHFLLSKLGLIEDFN